MPVKAVRCCQAYSGDPEHHDKPSHPSARHDCLDGDAVRDLRVACADRAARRSASQGRNPSGRAEGRAKGRSAGCRAKSARAGRSTTTTSGCGASAPRSAAAAPTGCSSATASDTAPAASGRRTPASDAAPTPGGRSKGAGTSATAPSAGRRTEGTGSTPATPCGGTFASDTAAAPSAGRGASGAEATGHTDDSTTTAAFIPEGDAITRAAAATGRREAVAGTRHHANSDSTTNGRPATRRKYDGAVAAYRPTSDTAECGRAHSGTAPASRTSRLAAACRAQRWHPRRSGRNTAGRRTYGADRGAGRAECRAAGRPGAKCSADCCASLPPGTSNHRTAAGGSATGSRRDQSYCPRYTSRRTAAP